MIKNYHDFIAALLDAGFSMGGGNGGGMYSIVPWGWDESPPYDTPVRWHTGDPDTDPWEWRMRVLDERDDIAYGKVFFKKAGYITKHWYPYFFAARRGGKSFCDQYADGMISHFAKRIYDAVAEHGSLSLCGIKYVAGFGREDKSRFDAALTELQMKLFLTMCGRQAKISQRGEEYGWSSTVFCTVETFWPPEIFEKAANIGADEAAIAITERLLKLNPSAEEKKIVKLIKG